MKNFTLKGIIKLRYTLTVLTGLHIGGAKESYEIGGLDNPVIKLPAAVKVKEIYGERYEDEGIPEGAPYIPGSSLKGKIRSLLEWEKGNVQKMVKEAEEKFKTEEDKKDEKFLKEAGKPCDCGECEICKTFGISDIKKIKEILKNKGFEALPGPPRVVFSDAYPTKDTLDTVQESLGEGLFTELKFENSLNRITNEANPRNQERVPAGSQFVGEITFKVFEDGDLELFKTLLEGMLLLENDYLGGSGSRGYGKVKFENLKVSVKEENLKTYGSVEELLSDWESLKSDIEARLKKPNKG